MSKAEYLMQAAQAERLARSVVDALTVDRLKEYAEECRAKARDLNGRPADGQRVSD
jgi:hypothetical protein